MEVEKLKQEVKKLQLLADPELYGKYNQLKEDIELQRKSNRELATEIESWKESYENLKSETTVEKKRLTKKHNEGVKQFNGQMEEYQKRFTSKLRILKEENSCLRLAERKSNVESANAASKILQARNVIRELEIDLLESKYKLERAYVELAKDRKHISTLKGENKAKAKQINTLVAQRDVLHQSSLALVRYLDNAIVKSNSIKKQCMVTKDDKKCLESQTQIFKRNILQQADKINELQQELKAFKTKTEEANAQKEKQVEEIDGLKKTLEESKQKLQFEQEKNERYIDNLKSQILNQEQLMKKMQDERTEKQQQEWQKDLAEMKTQLELLQKEKSETLTHMQEMKNDTELQKSRLAKQELKILLAEKELKIQKLQQKTDLKTIKEKVDKTTAPEVPPSDGIAEEKVKNKGTKRNRSTIGKKAVEESNAKKTDESGDASENMDSSNELDFDNDDNEEVVPKENDNANVNKGGDALERRSKRTRKLRNIKDSNDMTMKPTAVDVGKVKKRETKWLGKKGRRAKKTKDNGPTLFAAFIDKKGFKAPKLKQNH